MNKKGTAMIDLMSSDLHHVKTNIFKILLFCASFTGD